MSVPTSDVLHRKIVNDFKLLDHDGDGTITRADFVPLVDQLTSEFGYAAGSPEYQKFEQAVVHWWNVLVQNIDKDSDAAISEDEYVSFYTDTPPETVRASIDPYVDALFELIDGDGDGAIDGAEFDRYLGTLGIPPDRRKGVFQKLDVNGSGTLSKDEFRVFMHEFITSDDPNAVGNHLLGLM
ncbi:MAG: EF-hand domain-containing protein [Pseudonocardiaceae bacterium]